MFKVSGKVNDQYVMCSSGNSLGSLGDCPLPFHKILCLDCRSDNSIPANSHACGLKTLISCRLTLAGQFLTPDWKSELLPSCLTQFNSDPCKEQKPCVKWISGNTFLAISNFVDKRFLDNFTFGRLWMSSKDFGLLQESLEMISNVVFKNPSIPRIKISRLYLRKSWQVYNSGIVFRQNSFAGLAVS